MDRISETPEEFSKRANELLAAALHASRRHDDGDNRAFNRLYESGEDHENDVGGRSGIYDCNPEFLALRLKQNGVAVIIEKCPLALAKGSYVYGLFNLYPHPA
jgi:hypothetical protein